MSISWPGLYESWSRSWSPVACCVQMQEAQHGNGGTGLSTRSGEIVRRHRRILPGNIVQENGGWVPPTREGTEEQRGHSFGVSYTRCGIFIFHQSSSFCFVRLLWPPPLVCLVRMRLWMARLTSRRRDSTLSNMSRPWFSASIEAEAAQARELLDLLLAPLRIFQR